MAQKNIHTPLDRANKNNLNSNFTELFNSLIATGMNAADALEKANDALNKAIDANNVSESVQTQLDTIVVDGDSSVEAAQARIDLLNSTHATLKARDDADQMRSMKQSNAVIMSDFTTIEDAINYAVANSISAIVLDTDTASVNDVDFKGLNVLGGSKTEITGNPKGVKSLIGVNYRGIDQSNKQIGEFGSMSGTVTTKVFQRTSPTEFHVFSKKPYSNEYLDFRFEEGVTTTTNSAGAPAELMRVTGVFNLTKAYTQLTTPESMTGNWDLYEVNVGSASGIPNARNSVLKFHRNTETTSASIQFKAYAGEDGVISLGFFATNGTSDNVKVSIDGTLVATISAKAINGPYLLIKKIQTNAIGSVVVKIEKNDSSHLYVSSNTYKLHETPTEAKIDHVAFFDNGQSYITNKGAIDYAMVDENGVYWGSYHGGETLVSRSMIADKVAVGSTSPGQVFPCINFQMDQTTQIGTLFESRSSMRISRDGFFDFDFSLIGDSIVQTLYTTMTTTENKFKYVTYPKLQNVSADGTYYFGKTNRIIQEDIDTKQKVTTLFTRYEEENNSYGGVMVRTTTGSYNKVYYGPVAGGARRIKHLYGSNTRIFE